VVQKQRRDDYFLAGMHGNRYEDLEMFDDDETLRRPSKSRWSRPCIGGRAD
jgi:hypothetical protein